MRHIPALLLTGALALMPVALAADAPVVTPTASPGSIAAAQSEPTPGASPSASAQTDIKAPTLERYEAALSELLKERNIESNQDSPGVTVISDLVTLSVETHDDSIARISIVAHGNGSAQSGETIFSALSCAIMAYSPSDESTVRSKLLELMSKTDGQDSVPGLTLTFALKPDALELTLTPATAAVQPTQTATRQITNVGELISHCAALLPSGWTQTSYINGDPPDVLLNIYATSSEPDALWDCARSLMTKYFSQVRASNLSCGRLSVVFYSSGMTPLLSLGVGCADALASDAITSAATTDEFRAEIERLASESDALLVKHYDVG